MTYKKFINDILHDWDKVNVVEIRNFGEPEYTAQDAWNLARKILISVEAGGYDADTIRNVWGGTAASVFVKYDKFEDAMGLLKKYETRDDVSDEKEPMDKLLKTIEAMQRVDASLSDLILEMHRRMNELEKKLDNDGK